MSRCAMILGLAAMLPAPAAAAQAAADEPAPAELAVADGEVRLQDIAVIPAQASHLAQRVVARVPRSDRAITFAPQDIAAILRRQAPGLQLAARHSGAVTFVAEHSRAATSRRCAALTVAADPGDYIIASMLRPAACDDSGAAPAALAFDRTVRAPVAREALGAGTNLGVLHAPASEIVPADSAFVLRVRSGPVVIERDVRTLQAARVGERVFAVAQDGTVLAGQLAGEGN